MKRLKIRKLTKEELQTRLGELRKDIALLKIEQKVKPEKNTNSISLKKKEIARIQTRIRNEHNI